jgi:pimeloyl-ACP methyl ester carboxylesterase
MKFLWLCFALWPLWSHANWEKGFVRVSTRHEVYAEYKAARPGNPTFVFLHGLTYSVPSWNALRRHIETLAPDAGLLFYDMMGTGRTLMRGSLPVNYEIRHEEQTVQLRALLDRIGIRKAVFVGLSYGGGIGIHFAARYPNLVSDLVLMAPFTEALADQDRWIRSQVKAARAMNPWNPASDDELYDFFLRQFIYSTYPAAEPVILENPFKLEAVFRMVQGIRSFRAEDFAPLLPHGKVHLLTASHDQYIPANVMESFWRSVPAASRASRIELAFTEHKIPEAAPGFAAAWILELIRNPLLRRGLSFQGDTLKYEARSESHVISLTRP